MAHLLDVITSDFVETSEAVKDIAELLKLDNEQTDMVQGVLNLLAGGTFEQVLQK
jgi:hypothetical protein